MRISDWSSDVCSSDLALQLLRVRLLARLDVIGDVGRQVGGDLDVHSYLEKHGQAHLLELAWVALARLTVLVARSRRQNCTRSSSRVIPRPGPSCTVSWTSLYSSGSARISSFRTIGPTRPVPPSRMASVPSTCAEMTIPPPP